MCINIKTGDILEIPTKKGFYYLFVIFDYQKPPRYGKLVKVYKKPFKKRPSVQELEELVKTKEDFMVFLLPTREEIQKFKIQRVFNLGEQGYDYNNLPRMWIFRPSMAFGRKEINKHVALGRPGESSEEKYEKLSDRLANFSGHMIVGIRYLIDMVQKGYKPYDDLKKRWNNNS